MKKFFALVMTAMFALSSLATAASVLDGLKLSGELTVNKVQVKNEATAATGGNDYRSESLSRLMINMDMKLNDETDARIVLNKNNRKYGTGQENLDGVQTALDVVNAYVKVSGLFDLVDLKAGRMFYGKKNDLALYAGPDSDYALGVSALDGYLLKAEIGGIKVKYLDAKVMELGAPASNSDIDLQGLVLSPVAKIADMVTGEFYAYKNVDNSISATHLTDTTLLYGIKAAAEVGGADVKLEYAMNGGENQTGGGAVKYKGSAMIVGASMKVSAVNVRAEMASGSGNDAASADNEAFTAGSSDIRYGEVWGNTPATAVLGGAGIQNLNVINIGADYDVNDKLKSSVDYLMLTRNEVAAGASDDIGSEIDVKLCYAHSESVSLDFVVARLMSGKALADPAADIDKVNLQMNIKF